MSLRDRSAIPTNLYLASDGARRAAAAQRRWERGERGFYVTNAFTGLAIRGPFESHGEAAARACALEPPAMRVVER
jgi:hypothetical protein